MSSSGAYSYKFKNEYVTQRESDWEINLILYTDATATEHEFISVIPFKEDFLVTGLDGRNTLKNEKKKRAATSLRAAAITIGGNVEERMF